MNPQEVIVIIDDGVDNGIYNIGQLERSLVVDENMEVIENHEPCFMDFHGSTCAAIIKKYVPEAKFVSIKILNHAKGSVQKLVRAIEWCVENKCRVINLSLGTINYHDFEAIQNIVEYAYEKNVIIIAAFSNEDIFTLPASLDKVIGVRCDKNGILKNDEVVYIKEPLDGIEFMTSANQLLVDIKNESFETPCNNSYAAPVVTSIVYNLIAEEKDITFDDVKMKLKKMATFKDENHEDDFIINDKEIEVPWIEVEDLFREKEDETGEELSDLFRAEGYNAVYITDSDKSSLKHRGRVVVKRGLEKVQCVKKVERFFNPDLIISSFKRDYLHEGETYVSDIVVKGNHKGEFEIHISEGNEDEVVKSERNNVKEVFLQLMKILEG